jgi:prophage antirepressor-like protein
MAELATGVLGYLFEGKPVRFVGTAEKPEWVAVDVCDVLGIVNSRSATNGFDDDEKGVRTVDTAFGKQSLATVYEPGLYKLIFKSRKEEAKRFQKWVFNEVLPSLRKWGAYPPPKDHEYAISAKPYTARIVWVMQVRKAIPSGHWCIFIEGADLLLGVEHVFGPAKLEMEQYDLLDGSIGRKWSTFRAGKRWAGNRQSYQYTFPSGDPRGTVFPWAYPMCELEHFKNWLHTEYWTIDFPKYVKNKYGAKEFQKAIPILAGLGVPIVLSGS